MAEQNITTSVGKVILIEGNVYIKEVTGELIPLIEGMSVYAGQLIQTGPQGSILVELSNGEVLSLGRNTLVRLDEDLIGSTDIDENQTTAEDIRRAIEAVQEGNFDILEATAAGQQDDLSSAAQSANFIPSPLSEGEVTSGYETGTFNTPRQTINNRDFDSIRFEQVIPQNNTPVAVDDAITLNEDAATTINVLSNDSDLDGDSISVSAVSQPANGAVVINTDGTVTYTPAANYNGADSFTYTISDGQGGTSTATVNLTVDPVNDNPVAVSQSREVQEDHVISGVISASDTDLPEGKHLTFSTSSTVEGFTLNSDGSYQFDASAYDALSQGDVETLEIPITVMDDKGATAEASLTINVNGQNNDLTYVSESASYQNVIGIYEVGTDGKPVSGSIVLINQNGMQAGTHLADLDPEQDYEFFIISNGAGNISDTDSITFDNSGNLPVLLVDGQPSSDPVYYTQPEWNIDGEDHFKFILDGNGGTVINIEDLPNLGDADFNDVVLYTNFEMNNHIVVTSDVASESDSGVSDTDNITRDKTPIIQGNTESGATVIISDVNGLTLGQARANDHGDYAIEIASLAEGTHELTVTAIDGNGISATTTQSITIDTQIDSPVITNIIDHEDDYSNVTLYGTGEPGTTITLYNKEGSTTNGNQTNSSGFVPVATALPIVVDENGSWNVDISTLDNTPLNDNEFFYATQQDVAGNVSEVSNTVHYWHGSWSNAQSEVEDDFIMMGTGDDQVTIDANDTNDRFVADGGAGSDTAIFTGNHEDYLIEVVDDHTVKVTEINGDQDVNELRDFEFISFDDGVYDIENELFNYADSQPIGTDETVAMDFEAASSRDDDSGNETAFSTTNVVITLDVSGSMGSDNRLMLAKESLQNMINVYDERGSVNVKLVTFNAYGQIQTNTDHEIWMSAEEAINVINGLDANGSTNYEHAVYETYHDYSEPQADQTVAYFISDGTPTAEVFGDGDYDYLSAWAQNGWNSFVNQYVDELNVVALGEDISNLSYLEILASAGNEVSDVIEVRNENELSDAIAPVDTQLTVTGDLTDNLTEGDGKISFTSISVAGVTYTASDFANGQTIALDGDGVLSVDFESGTYAYTASASEFVTDVTKTFTVNAQDEDGDVVSFNVNIQVNVDDEASMPEIELSIGEMVAVTQEGYQYDGDDARNANGHGTHTLSYDSYAEALDAQNGANHNNGSLVYKNVNNAVWNLNDSNDKLFVVTKNASNAMINLAQGNNTIIFEKEPGTNIVINAGIGKDTLVLSGHQDDYNLNALNDDNGILGGLITGSNNMSMIVNNIDCIAFEDGSTVGDSSLYQGAASTAYFYPLEIEAELKDTDGSESLSNIQLTGLPDDGSASLTGTGVSANQDGSYTIELLEDGSISEDVKLASNRQLAEEELSDIHASVTAIEANGGDTAMAEVNDAGDHFLYGLDNEDDVFIVDNEDGGQDTYIDNFNVEHDVLDISDVISSEASEETLSSYLNLSSVDSDGDGQADDTKISVDKDGKAETQDDITNIYIQDNQFTDNNLDDMNIDFQNE